MVAALYVETGGVYYDLADVDPWDEERDARSYAGPWPVVAHPPCARWCRLAGFVEHQTGLKRGDDSGTFAAALAAVRTYGGVLEHPAFSKAWDAFNLPEPSVVNGWCRGMCGGWSAHIEQGRYGHSVKKATWLYAYGVEHLPDLRWGKTPDCRGTGLRNAGRLPMDGWRRRAGGEKGSSRTPLPFRDILLAMARTASA